VGLLADGSAWVAILRLDPIADSAVVDRLDQLLALLSSSVRSSSMLSSSVDADVDTRSSSCGRAPRRTRPGRPAHLLGGGPLRAHLHPTAVQARGGGEQGGIRSAAAAALRLATALRDQAFGVRVLDGTELSDEVCTSLGVEPAPRGGTGQPIAALGRGPSVAGRRGGSGPSAGCTTPASGCTGHRQKLAALFTQLARPPQ
jgi:hypothetical protein